MQDNTFKCSSFEAFRERGSILTEKKTEVENIEGQSGENIITDLVRLEVQEAATPGEGKINLTKVTPEVTSMISSTVEGDIRKGNTKRTKSDEDILIGHGAEYLNSLARSTIYPMSDVKRYVVPDCMVSWQVKFKFIKFKFPGSCKNSSYLQVFI